MTFEEAFRQALRNPTDPLRACMELLLAQNDYVDIGTLTVHCGASAKGVMGNFSRKIERFWNNDRTEDDYCHVTKELYLCVREIDGRREAYHLRPELCDIVREVLEQMRRRG